MRLRSKLALSLILSFGLAATAQADSVFVELATGSGVSASDLTAATTLVTTAVTEVSSDSVVDQEKDADIILRPTLMRLGQAVVLSLSRVEKGRVVFASQLKGLSMDELDKVATRLTRSVLVGENAKKNPRVGEITNEEALDGAQRRPTRSESYVSFGGTELGNLNSVGAGYSFAVGHGWDVNTALIKIIAEGDFVGSAWFASAGLGGNYFFTRTDIAPYVTADIGAGAAKIDGGGVLDGQTVGGFVMGAGAGLQFLRTTTVNLDLGFHAAYLLHYNQLGTPQNYTIRLGLYF